MYDYETPASSRVRQLLSSAARVLHTIDPTPLLGRVLDESLRLPAGDAAYLRNPHVFETRFSEIAPRRLALGMAVGDPWAPWAARVDAGTRAVRDLVYGGFGTQALRWLDGRILNLNDDLTSRQSGEAWLASGFDREGLQEAQITYAWSPETADALPATVHRVVQEAMAAMPSLLPAFTTVRCGRVSGTQEVTFRVAGPLRLADLAPLMSKLGLGPQHPRLLNALAFVLGARFVLPPDCALITLRPTTGGTELRIDVDLEAIPDVPGQLAGLVELQMAERPRSLLGLEHWVAAFTPEDGTSPGDISVLSVLVRPDLSARLALHLRPQVVAGPVAPGNGAAPAAALNGAAASAGYRR